VLDWWIGLGFALGSVCFAVAAIASQWASTPRPAIGVTFFVGSLFFTSAGYLQFRQGKDLASLIQLVGTVFFNVSCFAGMRHGLDTKQTDLRVWTPDAFGSVCFLVASELALAQVCGRWACVRRHSPAWQMAALNMLGSIAFGVAAVASLVQPSTSEPVSAAVANAGTATGALLFLAGALILIARSYGQVPATPGPVRVSERTPSR
jgi:YrhK-like protein